jgi:hypothetical protein
MTMLNLNEARSKTPIKNINEKGSILPDLKCHLMIHPLNIGNIRLWLSSVIEKAPLDPIKTPAVILSMSGAVLVAMPTTFFRMIGFGTWMISNTLWVIQGKKVNDFYLMSLFGFYFVTAAVGVVNLT